MMSALTHIAKLATLRSLWIATGMLLTFAGPSFASSSAPMSVDPGLVGLLCLLLFIAAYALVVLEDKLRLLKSIPVLMAAGFIWTLIAWSGAQVGQSEAVHAALRHSFLEFAELFFFLLVAMTYINTLEERRVFAHLQTVLLQRGLSLRSIFWATGALSFCISPIADNMTTALVMASVVMAVAGDNRQFALLACINIVVAANAGGAFSPFGDITTLMVWQKGVVPTSSFFQLLIPALVNWLVPAKFLSTALKGNEQPQALAYEAKVSAGGYTVIVLFLMTIAITVILHAWLHLPPVLGMMGGLGLLKLYSYVLARHHIRLEPPLLDDGGLTEESSVNRHVDVYQQVARAEWDTLLFFYGIILCVGGLAFLGYLGALSTLTYQHLGPTLSNVLVGVFSAVIDNIPVMYAVLSMSPEMNTGQWLLATLTAGVGGSLLSIGSAAGVAVMGKARGIYTFGAHLRWSWAIALGYAASIVVHIVLNSGSFHA